MESLIVSILEDMGFVLLDDDMDFDIRDYISDSIQFVEFIVNIEEALQIELDDEFLDYELLASLKAFTNKIQSFIDLRNENNTILS